MPLPSARSRVVTTIVAGLVLAAGEAGASCDFLSGTRDGWLSTRFRLYNDSSQHEDEVQ